MSAGAGARRGAHSSAAHRRLIVLRGETTRTQAEALRITARLDETAVLWISDETPTPARPAEVLAPREVGAALGRGFDAVVVDAHRGLDPDLLGQTHGMVRGGGALILRRPPLGQPDPDGPVRERLAALPFGAGDVGRRLERRLERALASAADEPMLLEPCPAVHGGTSDQAEVVETLARAWRGNAPTRHAVLADRGRGKSSALGLALRAAHAGTSDEALVVTAGSEAAAAEVLRFACDAARFLPIDAVLQLESSPRVLAIDEAAQLPVPVLQRLVHHHGSAHLAFATTTHGYEGTGRGFSLRFLAWLDGQPPAPRRLTMRDPIRWARGDPLEQVVFDALLLDAEPARRPTPRVPPSRAGPSTDIVKLNRDALAGDELRLRQLFGLLVHAHYRTTPADLHRLLDAPNLEVFAALEGGEVVGANVVAHEGDLSSAMCEEAAAGRVRLRAHALADALVAHLGRPRAGALRLRRSVRIAVHPRARRQGIATRLVQHTHAMADREVDAFGTLFGATADLVAFRRSLGYEVVRLSASRGTRTGEPSVMMLRPNTTPATDLVDELREELARELPLQLALLQADGELLLDPALITALERDLPSPSSTTQAEARELVQAYASGPRTFESVASAIRDFVTTRSLTSLPDGERRVLELRVLQGRGWRVTAAQSDLPSVAAAMRALRRAIRRLLQTEA